MFILQSEREREREREREIRLVNNWKEKKKDFDKLKGSMIIRSV